ncbi:MAG: nitrogen fixation protein NifZ [Xanthobacteraceae bacterium]
MALDREETLEILTPPRFYPCAKVRATKYIKNDGTYPNRDIGDILVHKGDVGYVRDVGTFLQRFYVYAVEFVDRGVIVGMRTHELAADDAEAAVAPASDASIQEPAA